MVETTETEHRPPERRRRNLTDADIHALVTALREDSHHVCRFGDLDPKIVAEAMRFYQNFNSVFGESGKIIWRTVLACGVGGFIVIIGMGVVAKIREIAGR